MNDRYVPPKRLAALQRAETLAWKINLLLDSIMTETGEPFGYAAVRDGAQNAGYYLSRSRWSKLKNGDEQTISVEGLRALASAFNVDAQYLLQEDGPVPAQVQTKFEQLKKTRRAEVREFAANALETVDPETFAAIARVLAEFPLSQTASEGVFNGAQAAIPGSRTSFQASELNRASVEVFAAAVDNPVQITRGDGEALVLMAENLNRERDMLMDLAAQLFVVPAESEGSLVSWMSDKLPWMLALNPAERDVCTTEILTAVRASLATNQPRRALDEVASWRQTAVTLAATYGREPGTSV